jgi:hypothetical protein
MLGRRDLAQSLPLTVRIPYFFEMKNEMPNAKK